MDEKSQYEEMIKRVKCRYYDKAGKEISLHEWADLIIDRDYTIIKKDSIGPYAISTIWLGLNHNMWGEPKMIFETIVFTEDETDDFYNHCVRYATLKEAELGHEIIAKIIEAKVKAKDDE